MEIGARLAGSPRTWLVTGAAGFIGSHLVETLLRYGQTVVGLDNLSTGSSHNIQDAVRGVASGDRARFRFIKGDVQDSAICAEACKGVDVVLHQAALGSVPRSVEDPLSSHDANVTGFLSMLNAARKAGVNRFVYASSSSVYGDSSVLPKREGEEGRLLSPYAATKRVDEVYAEAFSQCYGVSSVGLRYFNVFGPRQDPAGSYAAVIPRWILKMLRGEVCTINGDPSISRDFCFVENVVVANLLAATQDVVSGAWNIACGERTTLAELHDALRREVAQVTGRDVAEPLVGAVRAGDIAHSHADISGALRAFGYAPRVMLAEGMARTVAWYANAVTPAT